MVRFIDTVRKHITGRRKAPEPQASEEPKKDPAKARAKERTESEYRPRAAKASSPSSQPRQDPERSSEDRSTDEPRPPRKRRRRPNRPRTDASGEQGKAAERDKPAAQGKATESSAPREPREGDAAAHEAGSEAPRKPRRRRSRNRRRPSPEGSENQSAEARVEKTAPEPEVPAEPWDPASFQVEPQEGKKRFHDFELPEEIMHAIADLGFEYCTPIQAETLPTIIKGGDAAGRAQTGTGKTAAFIIALFKRMLENPASENRRRGTPRALVIAPTRELAMQIEQDAQLLGKYLPFNTVAIYGGMDYTKQQNQLREGYIDLVVATPGRLLDFKQKGDLHLSRIETLVIDEADRMLDMGFIPDVRRIVNSMPPRSKRQTLLFSATLTPEVLRLCSQWTTEPLMVEIEPEQVTVDTVEQLIYIVTAREKLTLLYNLITSKNLERVIVFGNRRDETRKLADLLASYDISSALLSGDVDQKKRVKTLENFKEGKIRVLVATDVAGRGLHIDGISHVVNFHLPMDPEDYVHRIGRTGRAGATGTAVSFACEKEAFEIPALEEFIGQELPCMHPDEDLLKKLPPPTHALPRRDRRGPGGPRGGRGGGRSGGSRGGRSGGPGGHSGRDRGHRSR